MRPRLRLFTGDDSIAVDQPQVSMRLGEVIRLLDDAVNWDRTWLTDFADDEIKVSADLYEILSAYSHLRPSA